MACEKYGAQYAIRLKANQVLYKEAGALGQQLYEQTREDTVSYAVVYGDFIYQAGSWDSFKRRKSFHRDSAPKISCFS